MALHPTLRASLTLPAVCAPMFLVSGPELVAEACKAGLMGGLPRQNARTFEEFEEWLGAIRRTLDDHEQGTGRPAGPLAVNLATRVAEDELGRHFDACERHGVKVLITVGGDPHLSSVMRMTQVCSCSTTSPPSGLPRKPSPPVPTGSTASAPAAAGIPAPSATLR
ncbi:MAG: hypothetical protein AB7S86_19940 [Hydrogenophaga sp.]|uniref:hypothetical protein n=1 Tax=Hydrogenophaga sp. TaxID=1904254 RepID=UPI003D0960BC